ncbi:MAG TPA: type II toxin-antitoxin system PemK/MazF family toxin [Limnochordia bacterium]|nr:type II toxin-antitoxin system PemK/MazF family toxin [Limnochordia bacterium]
MTGTLRRGDICYALLDPVIGSEQGGPRPVLVVQNDAGNRHSPTTIVAPITSRTHKARLPTHVPIPAAEGALARDSVVLLEQLRTIDKLRVVRTLAHLGPEPMRTIDAALRVSLGLTD